MEPVIHSIFRTCWHFAKGKCFCEKKQGYNEGINYEKASLTVHFKRKNCQTIPFGTLNVFYILAIHSDNTQESFVLVALWQPGGDAINFSKSPQNQNPTILLL